MSHSHPDQGVDDAREATRAWRGLYLLTPDWDSPQPILQAVRSSLLPGVAVLQLRAKRLSADARIELAMSLLPICQTNNTRFVINDDAELANAVCADGVHLGQADGDVAAARARFPALAIGVTCHQDVACAKQAATAGATYVAFGALHSSRTKPAAGSCPPAALREGRRAGLPVVAIGGMDVHNAAAAIAAGADMVAVLGAVFPATDGLFIAKEARARVAELVTECDRALHRRDTARSAAAGQNDP